MLRDSPVYFDEAIIVPDHAVKGMQPPVPAPMPPPPSPTPSPPPPSGPGVPD